MRVTPTEQYDKVVAERDHFKKTSEDLAEVIGKIRKWAERIEEADEPASDDEVTNSYNSGVMFSAMDVLKILSKGK